MKTREYYIVDANGVRVDGAGGFVTADGLLWAEKLLRERNVAGERIEFTDWPRLARINRNALAAKVVGVIVWLYFVAYLVASLGG